MLESPCPLRVMIMCEVRLYREALARVLAAQSGLQVVEDGADDLPVRICACQPNIVLADSSIVLTTELAQTAGDLGVRVVAFAVAEENEQQVLACAELGVAGFVARDATMDELL